MAEWKTKFMEYPNPAANCNVTAITFRGQIGTSYYHVDQGFAVEKYRKNAKTYSSESEIRGALLRRLLREVRNVEAEILSAIESVD